jgi:hypothetical protein
MIVLAGISLDANTPRPENFPSLISNNGSISRDKYYVIA